VEAHAVAAGLIGNTREMAAKAPSISDQKRNALLHEQNEGEVRGVLKEWKSVYGPGHPFAGGHEQEDPCRAIHAGKKGKK
jgi:hypothetical protein